MTNLPEQTPREVTGPILIAMLQKLIRANYEQAAARAATDGQVYQTVADVLCSVHPAGWTRYAHELPVSELADQIAASLFIRLRDTLTYGTPEYRAVDLVRAQVQSLRP